MNLKDEMLKRHAIIIHGKSDIEPLSYLYGTWVQGGTNKLTINRNPMTGKSTGFIRDCSQGEIERALRLAKIASAYWDKRNRVHKEHFGLLEISVLKKRNILDRFAHLLEEHRADLTLLIAEEMGKTAYTADADITETIHAAEHYRDVVHLAMAGASRDGQMPNKYSRTMRMPYGVVLAIKPFNFIALYWWTACAAIAAGNAVVFKASEDIPTCVNATVVLFHKALEEVLGDSDTNLLVQVLQGKGETVGEYAARHGDYDMLSFTGGIETAKILRVICAERGKRFHEESGGHAAIIVLDDFDLEKAADEIVLAAFGDAGQRCTSCKMVLAQESISDALIALVIKKAKRLRIGDPARADTSIGPIINERAFDRISRQLANTIYDRKGQLPVLGGMAISNKVASGVLNQALQAGFNIGEELLATTRPLGHFLVPTIFANLPYGACAMDQEIFGPVLVWNTVSGADRFDALQNAVAEVNKSRYGLSNALLTNDIRLCYWSNDHLRTGIEYNGRGTTGAEVPGHFSAIKLSGMGHEAYGIEEYSWVKQVWIDTHPTTRLAQTSSREALEERLGKATSFFT